MYAGTRYAGTGDGTIIYSTDTASSTIFTYTTSISVTGDWNYTWSEPSGISVRINRSKKKIRGSKVGVNSSDKRLTFSPKLYFNYAKTHLTKLEKTDLKERLDRLKHLIVGTKEFGQQGIFERLAKSIAIIVREQNVDACGYGTYITEAIVKKFTNLSR